MFNYFEKTAVGIEFEMSDLLRTINTDKDIKDSADVISNVVLSHTLSPETTNLEESENVKEIYVIDIKLKQKVVPKKFIEALNKTINFQILFRLIFENEIKYISSIKIFEEEKIKVLKMFESEWQEKITHDFPITLKLENVFKEMIGKITGYKFRQLETFDFYLKRLNEINKYKSEIENLTKRRHQEKQPNFKMALNDKIKDLKKELKNFE